MQNLIHALLNIDSYLLSFISQYGLWAYVVLFLIIFCETGLIITPFLPGDSLLFAAGSIAAQSGQPLSVGLLFLLLSSASILGNQVNFLVGRIIGPRIFSAEKSWLFNKKHLLQAHDFYEKHGGLTIILARFMPIVRTFVPFVAGIGHMRRQNFYFYNCISAVLWVGSLIGCGYFFGSLPIFKEHFALVIYGIVAISLLPPLLSYIYRKTKA